MITDAAAMSRPEVLLHEKETLCETLKKQIAECEAMQSKMMDEIAQKNKQLEEFQQQISV